MAVNMRPSLHFPACEVIVAHLKQHPWGSYLSHSEDIIQCVAKQFAGQTTSPQEVARRTLNILNAHTQQRLSDSVHETFQIQENLVAALMACACYNRPESGPSRLDPARVIYVRPL